MIRRILADPAFWICFVLPVAGLLMGLATTGFFDALAYYLAGDWRVR